MMNVRGPALAVIRGITSMSGALAFFARYAPNRAPPAQSLMSVMLNAKAFPQASQHTRSHWTNGTRTFARGQRHQVTTDP